MNTNSARSVETQISSTEEDILKSLRRIIRAVDIYSRKLINQTGLSGPQVICLRQLALGGPLQTSHLAQAVNLGSATVCGILDRLEQRGLIVRVRQANDRRCVLVSLSDAGRAAIGNAPPALHDSFLFKLRTLPAAQQEDIRETLTRIVAMMAADNLDAAPILVPGESVAPGPDRTP
jgi:DNA-binding MarR family transcriptional regulator